MKIDASERQLLYAENDRPLLGAGPQLFMVCNFDNHKAHLMGHLPYIWKPHMLAHWLKHVWVYWKLKKTG